MSRIHQLREQIDACRPGSDDLALPALAELAQAAEQDHAVAAELARSQQFDRAVAGAMHDVPLPSGLLDRLLAATQIDNASAEVSLPAPSEPAHDPSRSSRFSRRTWIVAGGSIAAVALAALTGSWILLRPTRTVSQADLAAAVDSWLRQPPTAWAANVPAQYLDPALIRKPQGWQTFRDTDGSGRSTWIVALNLAPPTAPRAILFVVPARAQYSVPSIPSTAPLLSLSRGYTATAWQRKDSKYLFVLVIETGRDQDLRQYLREPRAA